MRHMCLALIAFALVAPAGTVLQSQVPPSVLGDVPRNALIRVAYGPGPRIYGRHLTTSPDSLILSAPAPSHRYAIALLDIDTLWLQKGTAWRRGAAMGALTLGVVTGAAAYALSEQPCPVNRCLTLPIVYGAGIGFAIGGSLGVVVPQWRRFYPAAE